jgi:hypothetical protein
MCKGQIMGYCIYKVNFVILHAVKAYEAVVLKLHSFSASTVYGRTDGLSAGEAATDFHSTGSW